MSAPESPKQQAAVGESIEHAVDMDDLAPDGNVIIEYGEYKKRVASVVLYFAGYFEGMLKPGGFQESQHARSKENPLLLKLEDEVPEAVMLLLQILHHSKKSRIYHPSCEDIANLAVLAKKFLAVHCVQAQCLSWINNHSMAQCDATELYRLAKAAYDLGLEEAFSQVTVELVRWYNDEELKQSITCAQLSTLLRFERNDVLQRMQAIVQECVEALYQDDSSRDQTYITNRVRCTNPRCKSVAMRPGFDNRDNYPCSQCRELTAQRVACDSSIRCKDLTSFLKHELGIWPTSKMMDKRIGDIIPDDPLDCFKRWKDCHVCSGGDACPIWRSVGRQQFDVRLKGLDQLVQGVQLRVLRYHLEYAEWY